MALIPQLDRLMDNARVSLPSVLDAAIKLELFNVLEEFCKQSLVWREDIPVEVTPASKEYDATPSWGAVTQLISLVNSSGISVGCTMEEPGFILLTNTPSTSEELTATVALTVVDPLKTDGYPEIPDWILTKYYLGLLDGVKGRLMSQPAKPYSNERLGIYHLRRFRDAIANAYADASRKNLHGAQRWRFPRFA
jgi:hypothetical protein